MKAMVNVWVYTSILDDWFRGEAVGYLYPLEPRYQTQLIVPYVDLFIDNEKDGTCKKIRKFISQYETITK